MGKVWSLDSLGTAIYQVMSSQTAKKPTSGTWKPLEATEFEGLRRGVEALQFLQRAQHIGKAQRAQRAAGWWWLMKPPKIEWKVET